MPYSILQQDGVLCLCLTGTVDREEVYSLLEALDVTEKRADFPPNRIIDLRAAYLGKLEAADVRSVAAARSCKRHQRQYRCALVAEDPLAIGLARMLHALVVNPKTDMKLFKDFDQARAWARQV